MSLQGLLIGTCVFVALILIGILYVNHVISKNLEERTSKFENRGLASVLVTIAGFCMWLHWACAYMHQMNPLIMPKPEVEVN